MSQKKTCHYIFDDNFNKNCPIAIIFGILITQTIGHRKVVSFSPPHLVCATILPWRTQNTKIHKFRSMQHHILRKTKLGNLFHTNVPSVIQCSKCRPCARTHAFSLFPHSLIVKPMTFCYRPFQTLGAVSAHRRLFKSHSYSRCCVIPHIL